MKHPLLATNLLIIAATMISCQKEQSELHLESMPSSAVITGTVKYVVGDYETSDAVISNYQLPLAQQTVMVTIPTAEYVDKAEGNQYFETVTDENGNYRIEIPISSGTLNASVDVLPFYATKTLLRDKNIVEIPNSLYNDTMAGEDTPSIDNVTLEQKKIEVVNLVVDSDAVLPVAFDQKVNVIGEVTVDTWIKNPDAGSDSENDAYIGSAGSEDVGNYPVSVTAKIIDSEGGILYEITMNTTTDRDGKYSVEMTLPTNCYDDGIITTFTAGTDAAVVEDFEHWYAIEDSRNYGEYIWERTYVEVVYNAANSNTVNLSEKNKLGIDVKINSFNISTEPADSEAEIPGINLFEDGNDNIMNNDPFDWA